MELALFLIVIVIMVLIGAKTYKNSIQICKGDCIFSNILNEKRKLWVYIPKTAEGQEGSQQKYPVIYLLDAEEHFRNFTEMIQQVNPADGSRLFPDMIVIGIPNTKRSRDLTPTHFMYGSNGNKDRDFKLSGGGEKFIEFIENELIPHVDATYPTTAYKALTGHSLGGLTVVNILLNHTELFDGYIASDPSMWWDNKLMLIRAQDALKQQRFDGRTFFMSIANDMPAGMSLEQMHADTGPKTNHIRCIFELADMLENNKGNGLRSDYKYYQNETHNSVPPVTHLDGLRLLLDKAVVTSN
jgi:predicted alpha/beta superfamily hydrolase